MNSPIRILGLDPGLRKTGWGVIVSEGSKLGFVACGCIESAAGASLAERLRQLHDGIAGVIASHAPDEAAVEETFVNRA